ncbi:MAG: type II secretion system F family protein [Cellulosilyticaceae bacterium]
MNQYIYKARDIRSNKILKGEGAYNNAYELKQHLASMDLVPLKVETKTFLNTEISSFAIFQKKIKLEDIALFCRQFATMIESGISVGRSLDLARKECQNPALKRHLKEVHEKIKKGKRLSEAMGEITIFPFLLVRMIEIGEVSGHLENILNQLANYFENQLEMRKKVKKALLYPMIVCIVLCVVFPIMMVQVIPAFVEMFRELEVALPLETKIIIGISDWFVKNWEIILIINASLILSFIQFRKNHVGKKYYDALTILLPLIGKIKKQLLTIRFCESMALLLGTGTPILQALENTKMMMNNSMAEEELDRIKEAIKKGYSLREALQTSRIYPEMMINMISIGEETGEIDKMLIKVGEYFSTQTKGTIDYITVVIEPALIILIGLFIGLMMFAITTPTFTLATELI